MSAFENIGGLGWDSATYWLYVAVAAVAGLFSWFSVVGTRGKDCENGRIVPFVTAMVVLVVFKGLCASTVDVRTGYYLDFQSAESFETFRDHTLEPLYQVLNIVVYNVVPDYGVFLVVVAALTIAPVGYVIWKCRSCINVPFAVLGYALIFLVTGMSAIRQFVAVSLVLLATYYWVVGKKHVAVVWAACALGFHASALVSVLLFVLLAFRNRIKWQLVISAACVAAVILARALIESYLVGRYSDYGVFEEVSFGLAVILKYLPLLMLMLFVLWKDPLKSIALPSGASSAMGLCCAVLFFSIAVCLAGYIVSIFGRAESYSVVLIIMIAYLVRRCEEQRFFRIPAKGLLLLYFMFRFTLQMGDYYLLEGLMPYITSFGLQI